MRNRRDDLRNIALIVGAGALGVVGTVFMTKATERPGAEWERIQVRQQAVVEALERVQGARAQVEEARNGLVVVGSASSSEGIRIRRVSGEAGVLTARPIIYIDGVRVDGSPDEAMKKLSPDQIDRIEILKGGAAKQQYGSEAQDGVIQIFTKSSEGSPKKKDGSGP